MFRYFGLSVKKDERDIEELMLDISENHYQVDYQHLYRWLKDKDIFIPVNESAFPEGSKSGDKFVPAEPTDLLKIKSILGPNDQPLVPAATTNTCAMLNNSYLRMNWIDFLNMVLETADTDGTFLEGEINWVRFDKERIIHILNSYIA
ncbi:MAG: hypothetical protein ACC657_03340 [Thiohalomonadales bacterium]